LWGDIYFHKDTRTFKRTPSKGESSPKRSFVEFILEPLYKLYSQVIGEDQKTLQKTCEELGISLKREQFTLDVQPLLKLILTQFFGKATGFVEMVVKHIPSPIDAAASKVEKIYTGPMNSDAAKAMVKCDPKGPLMIHITKLYP
jgi:116 kDa U5 small nuclear ribonucleoprotein component